MPESVEPAAHLESIELSLTSKIDVDGLGTLMEKALDLFAGLELDGSKNFSQNGMRFQVKDIVPGKGVVTKDTKVRLTFTPRKLPHCYVVAIDRSYSMNKRDYEPTRLGAALAAVEAFLKKKTGSGEPVGILSYGVDWDLAREPEPLKKNAAAVTKKSLDGIKTHGKASIADAVGALCEVYEVLDPKDALKIGMLISDGVDEGQDRLPGLLERARDHGIVINTFFIGDGSDHDSIALLENIASGTGGIYGRPEDTASLERDFVALATRTTLELTASPVADVPADETIAVSDDDPPSSNASRSTGRDTSSSEYDIHPPALVNDDHTGATDDHTDDPGTDGTKDLATDHGDTPTDENERESAAPPAINTDQNIQGEDIRADQNTGEPDETVIRVEGPPPSRLLKSRKQQHRTKTFREALKDLIDKLY